MENQSKPMENQSAPAGKKRKRMTRYIPLVLVVLIVFTLGWMWYRNYLKYISTDDAYIQSDNVSVSSKILGRIATEYADEGEYDKNDRKNFIATFYISNYFCVNRVNAK